ncbi:MAG TPA: alpha-L-fucosidase [Prolixibacteraceae bacterium]|nr:alpha-L-fucosidase [Prolixibacteraceae bacterium]
MKNLIIAFFFILAASMTFGQDAYEVRQKRTEWFREARFGMFIHWGVYAVPARGEWVRNKERITLEDYQKYVDDFNPVDYNPAKWAKIAKQAGMKYAVITVKHHDGFCMFDSKYTDYKATNTPAGRDLIKEFVDAFRAEGLRVGFYYSLIDWHHPDYPNVGNHPMAKNPEWDKKTYNFDKYLDYMYNQVEELVTNYGKIDILWFDYSFGEYSGEKWRGTKLVEMVRKKQPDIIIDNRLGGNMQSANPEKYAGDFGGPEQVIPPAIWLNDAGRPLPWELCLTLNNSWGYTKNDTIYKSPDDIIQTLMNCVSKNGNLLLNVGPDERGNIPAGSIRVLEEVGNWMKVNSESIYGCGPSKYPKPEWGWFTQKGNILYAHLSSPVIGQQGLRGMKGKVKNATLLYDGSSVRIGEPTIAGTNQPFVGKDDLFITLRRLSRTGPVPDQKNMVVKLELNE